nr:replication protein A 70 kDa DNA-binding subunit D-like [Ziziphus jujuba var. spinosa]
MACIMVMMTYSMVRIELVYFIQNSGLHYCTSEKTLTYHLFSPPTLFISDDKKPEDCVIHYKIDVIGIAIEIKPKKEIITNDGLEIVQEMTLMNDNMDTVMLTMWNQFVNNEYTQILNIMNRKPIIIGCRLKVSSYNGISLSTKPSSSFVIEPEIPQAVTLSIW